MSAGQIGGAIGIALVILVALLWWRFGSSRGRD